MTRNRKQRRQHSPSTGRIDAVLFIAPVVRDMLADGRLTVEEYSDFLGQALGDWRKDEGRCLILAQFPSHRLFVIIPPSPQDATSGKLPHGITFFAEADVATMPESQRKWVTEYMRPWKDGASRQVTALQKEIS